MGNALENLRHLIDSYGWRENRDMQDFIDAADMIDMQYVELQKDADGVPIRIGDMMHGTCPSGKYVCGEVSAIGDNKLWLCNVQFSLRTDYMHHHEPTVEDVLREFGDWYTHTKGGCDEDGIIADYAAKLRLAGDAAGPNELAMAYHVGYDDALAKRKPDANKVMRQ